MVKCSPDIQLQILEPSKLRFHHPGLNACDSALSLKIERRTFAWRSWTKIVQRNLKNIQKTIVWARHSRYLCRVVQKVLSRRVTVRFAVFFWRETASHVCPFSQGANSSWKALTGAVLFDSTWLRKCHMCNPWSTPSVWCILLMFPWCR